MALTFKLLFAALFIFGGINHFLNPNIYLRIMPPYLPWHAFLVYASGMLELLFGILLLIPKTQALAGWGLIVLLIAIFPANLHMALNAGDFRPIPPLLLWLRLPLQLVLIAWAYVYARG